LHAVRALAALSSGVVAQCVSSYLALQDKTWRAQLENGSVELMDAFAHRGERMRVTRSGGGAPPGEELRIRRRNQFAQEIDDFARSVRSGARPHTLGQEGLQDRILMRAIAASARDGMRPLRLEQPPGPTRGPASDQAGGRCRPLGQAPARPAQQRCKAGPGPGAVDHKALASVRRRAAHRGHARVPPPPP